MARSLTHVHAAQLAYDMESLGLSPEDLNPVGQIESTRALARAQSAQIMSKRFMQRDRMKQQYLDDKARSAYSRADHKTKKLTHWKHKTANSPFMVNLVAEGERIEEEHQVRIESETRRASEIDARQREAKQEIILRALQEDSELEALRREKRAIIEEERRLKALLDLEKTNVHRKQDRLAAARAEKQRHMAKREFRRREQMSALADIRHRETDALRLKHDTVPPPSSTFEDTGYFKNERPQSER